MRLTKYAAAAAAFGVVLTGCSSEAGNQAAEQAENTVEVEQDLDFEAGTTMAEIAEAGTITIGTKYDQPGFGLLNPEGVPEGFDVEMGVLIAAALGIEESDIEWVEAVSANREPFIQNGTVDVVIATYTINDTRKALVDFAGPTTRPARTSWSPPATRRASRVPTTSPARTSAPWRVRRRPRTSGTTTPRRR